MLKEQKEIKNKLQECEKIKQEYLTGWQRSRADFLNYKKGETERINFVLTLMQKEWMLEMLKIHDNLERARERTPKDLKDIQWVKGVLQIENQFHQFFKEHGVERMDPIKEKFNPALHQAIEEIKSKDKEKGIVIKVIEKGYLLNGRLLRPAKVRVAK